MKNFVLDKNNLILKNFDVVEEVKKVNIFIKEMRNTEDERIFWQKAKLAFELIIKIDRYRTILGVFPEDFNCNGYVRFFINELANQIFYMIQEFLFGFRIICSEKDGYDFVAKVYPDLYSIPYINILDLDFEYNSILFLTNEIPQIEADLVFSKGFEAFEIGYFYKDSFINLPENILKWANSKNEDGINNWIYAQNVYRELNNFRGNFKSKNSKFGIYSLDKVEKHWLINGTKIFKAKKIRKRKFNPREFKLRKYPLSDELIKFPKNGLVLPKNFDLIREMSKIRYSGVNPNDSQNYVNENLFWSNLSESVKKLQIINKFYDVKPILINTILQEYFGDYFYEFLFGNSFINDIFENYNFKGMIFQFDQAPPHVHIFDKTLNEVGRLFITREVPKTETDLRFSEDSDKNISPEILRDILKFANDNNCCNWEKLKKEWVEYHDYNAIYTWEKAHGKGNYNYSWFKSKDDNFL